MVRAPSTFNSVLSAWVFDGIVSFNWSFGGFGQKIGPQEVLLITPSVRINFPIFFFEGGTRCGKGEGIHILRLDDPQDLLRAFEAASSSRLESKRKSMYKCKC